MVGISQRGTAYGEKEGGGGSAHGGTVDGNGADIGAVGYGGRADRTGVGGSDGGGRGSDAVVSVHGGAPVSVERSDGGDEAKRFGGKPVPAASPSAAAPLSAPKGGPGHLDGPVRQCIRQSIGVRQRGYSHGDPGGKGNGEALCPGAGQR